MGHSLTPLGAWVGAMGSVDMRLPPGFRFHPTDEELVMHYLCRKCAAQPIAVPIIADVDLYKHDPWQLPGLALHGEREWYFFSPRDRKYPNGSRPNRAAGTGYWKATGADKPIGMPEPVGIKKALVFYAGKAPKGEKTNWIMHEYRLAGVDRSAHKRNSLRLDDWVLCRIYNKKGASEKHNAGRRPPCSAAKPPPQHMMKQEMQQTLMPPLPTQPPSQQQQQQQVFSTDYMCLDNSDSVVKPHPDSSCSEHVLSPHDCPYEREVQSQPSSLKPTAQASIGGNDSVLQDILMYIQKPF